MKKLSLIQNETKSEFFTTTEQIPLLKVTNHARKSDYPRIPKRKVALKRLSTLQICR